VRYEWLKPGAIVVNVSLDDVLPEVYLRCDLLFVDDWNLVQEDTRRLLGKMHRQQRIAGPGSETIHSEARKVDGEISDLVLGRHPGRKNPEDIVVVNPFGLGIEDVALASRIFQMAVAHQKGIRLPR
jgi:ornithine cyclodeaminase/alanine dehydrogenase-like protein (mu-crystallin family)